MAAPASLPDVTLSRVSKSPFPRPVAEPRSDQGGDSFERVQKNLSKPPGPKPEEPQKPDMNDNKADARAATDGDSKPGTPEETAEPGLEANPNPDRDDASTLGTMREGWAPPEQQDSEDAAFGLFMPISEPAAGGDSLPVPKIPSLPSTPAGTPAMPGTGPNGLMDMHQLITQGSAGAKAEEALMGSGKALGELDLTGFKTTLAEAVDGQGGRVADAPLLVTSQRGLELREGSALVRQYSTTVETPVQQGEWGERMAGKISWLANQRISFAEIHLNPADLGPVEVRVRVQNDQASVALHAQNPSVRDMLELNGNRLRDMLQDNGLNLARMDVSDQPSRQQQRPGDESGQRRQGAKPGVDESGPVRPDGEGATTGEISLPWLGRVNTYA